MWYFYIKYRIMILFPISKINLGLRITAKRTDGYHNIETIFYPVNLTDALEFVVSEKTDEDQLTTTGLETGSGQADNLVLKTIRRLRAEYNFPFLKIHLHKAIPIGAGLGGGSSDAASLLKAIESYFSLNISEEKLKLISLDLGSDCPFFIDGFPSAATGRGEILNRVAPVMSGYYLVLLNPGVGINTREAYQNCSPSKPADRLEKLILNPISEWKELIKNDFEDFAFRKYPSIGEIKKDLYKSGALFSLMSGSGSSVYGIFRDKPILPDSLKRYVIFEGKM
jgi:4-diphosphocytidyl-2-C-methyl-D-erythritol kinase